MTDKYNVQCAKCGAIEGLQMIAHRKTTEDAVAICGWLFVCDKCIIQVEGHELYISIRGRSNDGNQGSDKPCNSD